MKRMNVRRMIAAGAFVIVAATASVASGPGSSVGQVNAEPGVPAAEERHRGEEQAATDHASLSARSSAVSDTGLSRAINTDFLIVDAAPGQATGMTGVSVHWSGPSHRNPYSEWDWIEILEGGSRVAWNWVCPKKENHCDGAYGATFVNTGDLKPGKKFTIKYWSKGGWVFKGTLRAEAEFVS
ncbi:hypothetical protein [Streptomyces sp. SS8]